MIPDLATVRDRAKNKIRLAGIPYQVPSFEQLPLRLESVLAVVYLIFNEGYNSSGKTELIRRDLCEEAIRLSLLLTENSYTRRPKCLALVSLLTLQASRFDARLDESGSIVRWYGINTDIEDRKHAEAELRRELQLVRIELPGPAELYLKLETLQPIAGTRASDLASGKHASRTDPNRVSSSS